MKYVEVRAAGAAFQVTIPGVDAPIIVSNERFIEPLIGDQGVRATGPWEVVLDESGAPYQRALIL